MAQKQNLLVKKGTDFVYSFEIRDDDTNLLLDLSDFTATAVARKHVESNTTFSFSTAVANGVVTLSLGWADTANVDLGDWIYTVKMYDTVSNVTSVPVEGRVRVSFA